VEPDFVIELLITKYTTTDMWEDTWRDGVINGVTNEDGTG
jgi:hypothetical protein